ncbi:MAG TPA: hypothetical protein VFQ24_10015 [Terriglobia bacterium]|nr:hypothetical protein [Terriglobia bacterium]
MKTKASEVLKHSRRACKLLLATCVFIGPVGSSLARSRKVQDQAVVSVAIYDYANVGRTHLGQAEGHAAGIFAKVGVRIAWTDYSLRPGTGRAKPENSDADFFVRILPGSMARRGNRRAGALGESVISPTAEGPLPGGTANVFYDRVEHISSLWDLDPGKILGDAIAHELGHLLLGANHSDQGIMKALWSVEDLEMAKSGKLWFCSAETAAIQRAARSLPQNLSTMAAAPN